MSNPNFNRMTVAVNAAADQIDEVCAAMRHQGQDKNEPEFNTKQVSKLDQASNALRDAMNDPTLADIGDSSVDSASNNPHQPKVSVPKVKHVAKGGEMHSPANSNNQ